MDEDEEYDSDSTVLLIDYVENPQKIDIKRRRLSRQDRVVELDKHEDNIISANVNENVRTDSLEKHNMNEDYHTSKYFSYIDKENNLRNIISENGGNDLQETMTRHLTDCLTNDEIFGENTAKIDNYCDIICLDSDDETRSDENSRNLDINKIENSTEKPAAINSRRATTNIFERNFKHTNSNVSQGLEENTTGRLRILTPSIINTRRASTHFECNLSNTRQIVLKKNKMDINYDQQADTAYYGLMPTRMSGLKTTVANIISNVSSGVTDACVEKQAENNLMPTLTLSNNPLNANFCDNVIMHTKYIHQDVGNDAVSLVNPLKRFGKKYEMQTESKRTKMNVKSKVSDHNSKNTEQKATDNSKASELCVKASNEENKELIRNKGSDENDEIKGSDEKNINGDKHENTTSNLRPLNKIFENRLTKQLHKKQEERVSIDKQEISKTQFEQAISKEHDKQIMSEVQNKQQYLEETGGSHDKNSTINTEADDDASKGLDKRETNEVLGEPYGKNEANNVHGQQKKYQTYDQREKSSKEDESMSNEAQVNYTKSDYVLHKTVTVVANGQISSAVLDERVITEPGYEIETKQVHEMQRKSQLQCSDIQNTEKQTSVEFDDQETIHDQQRISQVSYTEEVTKVQNKNLTRIAHNEREPQEVCVHKTTQSQKEQESNQKIKNTSEVSNNIGIEDNKLVLRFQVGFLKCLISIYPEYAIKLNSVIQTLKTDAKNGTLKTDVQYGCPKCNLVSNYSSSLLDNTKADANKANSDISRQCYFCRGLKKLHTIYLRRFFQEKNRDDDNKDFVKSECITEKHQGEQLVVQSNKTEKTPSSQSQAIPEVKADTVKDAVEDSSSSSTTEKEQQAGISSKRTNNDIDEQTVMHKRIKTAAVNNNARIDKNQNPKDNCFNSINEFQKNDSILKHNKNMDQQTHGNNTLADAMPNNVILSIQDVMPNNEGNYDNDGTCLESNNSNNILIGINKNTEVNRAVNSEHSDNNALEKLSNESARESQTNTTYINARPNCPKPESNCANRITTEDKESNNKNCNDSGENKRTGNESVIQTFVDYFSQLKNDTKAKEDNQVKGQEKENILPDVASERSTCSDKLLNCATYNNSINRNNSASRCILCDEIFYTDYAKRKHRADQHPSMRSMPIFTKMPHNNNGNELDSNRKENKNVSIHDSLSSSNNEVVDVEHDNQVNSIKASNRCASDSDWSTDKKLHQGSTRIDEHSTRENSEECTKNTEIEGRTSNSGPGLCEENEMASEEETIKASGYMVKRRKERTTKLFGDENETLQNQIFDSKTNDEGRNERSSLKLHQMHRNCLHCFPDFKTKKASINRKCYRAIRKISDESESSSNSDSIVSTDESEDNYEKQDYRAISKISGDTEGSSNSDWILSTDEGEDKYEMQDCNSQNTEIDESHDDSNSSIEEEALLASYMVKRRKERVTKLFGDENETLHNQIFDSNTNKEGLNERSILKLHQMHRSCLHCFPDFKTRKASINRKCYRAIRKISGESESSSNRDSIVSTDESEDNYEMQDYRAISKISGDTEDSSNSDWILSTDESKDNYEMQDCYSQNTEIDESHDDSNSSIDEETLLASDDENLKTSIYTVKKRKERLSNIFGVESDRDENDDDQQVVNEQNDNNPKALSSDNNPSDDETIKVSTNTIKKRKERLTLFNDDIVILAQDNDRDQQKRNIDIENTHNSISNVDDSTKQCEAVPISKNYEESVQNKEAGCKTSDGDCDMDPAPDSCITTNVSEEKNTTALNNAKAKPNDDHPIEVDLIDCLHEEYNMQTLDDQRSGLCVEKEKHGKDGRAPIACDDQSEVINCSQGTCQSVKIQNCLEGIQITNVRSISNKLKIFVCQECSYATDTYDDTIRHCQNHYNQIQDPVTYCSICQIKYDTSCFERHEVSHDKYLINIKITFSYQWLFSNWQAIFENHNIKLSEVEDMQLKSIYKTHCVKMTATEDGPWQTALYKCAECKTCVPLLDIEKHVQEKCKFENYPCSICNRTFLTHEMREHHKMYHTNVTQAFKTIVFNDKNDKNFNLTLIQVKSQLVQKYLKRRADIYKCMCGLHFNTLKKMKMHFVDCDAITNNGIKCTRCPGLRQFLPSDLENHLSLHHSVFKYEVIVQQIIFQEETAYDSSRRESVLETTDDLNMKRDMLKDETLSQDSINDVEEDSKVIDTVETAAQSMSIDDDLNIKIDAVKVESLSINTNEENRNENVDIFGEGNANQTMPNNEDLNIKRDMLKNEPLSQETNGDNNVQGNQDMVEKDLDSLIQNAAQIKYNEEDLNIKRDMLKCETLSQDINEENRQEESLDINSVIQNAAQINPIDEDFNVKRDMLKYESLSQGTNEENRSENLDIVQEDVVKISPVNNAAQEDLNIKRDMLKNESLSQDSINNFKEDSESINTTENEVRLCSRCFT